MTDREIELIPLKPMQAARGMFAGIDTSVANAEFVAPLVENEKKLIVPQVVVYEVTRRLVHQRGAQAAYQALELLGKGRLVSLDVVGLCNAAIATCEHKLVMADAHGEQVYTQKRGAHPGTRGSAGVSRKPAQLWHWVTRALPLAAGLLVVSQHAAGQGAAPDPAATRWPVSAQAAPVPDDSPAAREAAVAYLRATPRTQVCRDSSHGSRPFGTTCASREFDAPPRLQAPRLRWSIEPGWRGLWSPYLIGDMLLTGSCFNETHKGLSAIDTRNGRVLWRTSAPCDDGNRNGSVGESALHEWQDGQLLWALGRNDGKPADHLIIDLRNGRVLGKRNPAKRGAVRQRDGVFLSITHSEREQTTYLNGMGPQLETLLWQLAGFRYKCDELDRFCERVFSPSAGAEGIEYFSATAKDQSDPPTRQLHAVELRSGRVLWRHQDQPVTLTGPGRLQRRSDDGAPLVTEGQVIIRVDGTLGPAPVTSSPGSFAYRALHARTGQLLWTSEALPTRFRQPWAGSTSQQRGTRLAAGRMLVTEVLNGDGSAKELWAYRLADGSLAWRRPVSRELRLMASAGGVIHVAIDASVGGSHHTLQGLDSNTGTLLWATEIPKHNNPMSHGWHIEGPESNVMLAPFFRIARDGAIYGTTVTTAYKLD